MSTGWSKAAELYKVDAPNDVRLGWGLQRTSTIAWIARLTLVPIVCYAFYAIGASLTELLWYMVFLLGLCIVAYVINRFKKKSRIETSASDDQLRTSILQLQQKVLYGEPNSSARHALGMELGAATGWLIVWGSLVGILIVSHHLNMLRFLGILFLGVAAAAHILSGRWIRIFRERLQKGDCINCGHSPGRLIEQVSMCPECNVAFPLMEVKPSGPKPVPQRAAFPGDADSTFVIPEAPTQGGPS